VASSPGWYRPRGGSLVITVVARFLWLPLLSGGAITLATGSREGGVIGGAVLLAVELATYRWRWAWRTLDVRPAAVPPADGPQDVRRQAWGYGIGVALLGLCLAAWRDYAAVTPDKLAELGGIVVGTELVAGGHLLFEHLVRHPRWPLVRSRLGGDDVIDAPAEVGFLLLLAPRSWQLGGATVVMIACLFLCAVVGIALATGLATTTVTAFELVVMSLAAVGSTLLGGFSMSMLEAHHATAFVNVRRKGEIEDPPAD
jgi:hypothetical protein